MKRILIAMLALTLVLTACKTEQEKIKEDMPPTREAPETDGVQKEHETGINNENYPRIDGSTSTLKIVQALYREFIGDGGPDFPESASKTVPSYRKLIDGEVDMIFVPYASEDVLNEAKSKNVELEFYPVAAEALIFITPVDNTAENITKEQVRSIYLDYSIKNWKEIGGPDKKLIPVCRNSDSGSQSQMDNLVLKNEKMHPGIKKNYVELTMEGMLEQVAFYHSGGLNGKPTDGYALGYTLYTYLKNINEITGIGERLKILSYEGVEPTVESIGDGSYTLADAYYAVVRKDLPAPHSAREIVKWLGTDDGVRAIERLSMISVIK